MNRKERVTQRRDREEKKGIYIYIYIYRERESERERERELYTFVIVLKWLYKLRIFFSNAEAGFNEAIFLGVMTSYKFVYLKRER